MNQRYRLWEWMSVLLLAWMVVQPSGTSQAEAARPSGLATPCINGLAGAYPCRNVDLAAHLPLGELNPPSAPPDGWASDLWGWADPTTGAEYALVGVERGISVADVSSPEAATVVAFIPTPVIDDPRGRVRDVKVYQDHAFIVSEINQHGMQVIDLRQLPAVVEVARYQGVGRAHNIAIDEVSGYAYISGSDTCAGGLHIVDIRTPAALAFVGCYEDRGYSHDAHCLTYPPSSAYPNREICFSFNADEIAVLDVTDKAALALLSTVSYPERGYIHQGWTTEDRQYLFQNDEFDELQRGINTTTYIWDISDLSDPQLVSIFANSTPATDHNLYIRGDYVYEANYSSGMRILDISDETQPCEVGYFDIVPGSDAPGFEGAWSAYPYLPSGTLLLSGRQQGLFVLQTDELPPCQTLPAASYLPIVVR